MGQAQTFHHQSQIFGGEEQNKLNSHNREDRRIHPLTPLPGL